MLPSDETQALAARARLAARAVVGLVLDEERAARFVYEYSSEYRRLGIAGEAERKAELFSAIERESLLLVAAHLERTLPQTVASRFSRRSEPDAVAAFRQAFLTFLGGSLAWDYGERESFRKDLAMYLRLAAREGHSIGRRRGALPIAGAFVDRCAFLIDPSMMGQAREAAARYQASLESCADQALRAAFRGLRARASSPALPAKPHVPPKSRAKKKARPRKAVSRRKPAPRKKPARRARPSTRRTRQSPSRRRSIRKSPTHRKPARRTKAAIRGRSPVRKRRRPSRKPTARRNPARRAKPTTRRRSTSRKPRKK